LDSTKWSRAKWKKQWQVYPMARGVDQQDKLNRVRRVRDAAVALKHAAALVVEHNLDPVQSPAGGRSRR
jgi:hypothetical protein